MVRALITTAAAVLVVGCGPAPCRLVFGGARGLDPGGVEGQKETVEVSLGVSFASGDCSKVKVESVSATVLDANNAPVPNTVELINAMAVTNASASVSFTPPVAGAYHLALRFEPQLGTVQRDLLVAADRSDAGVHTAPVLPGCAVFGLSNGQPLCLGAGMLRTIGSSAAIDQVDAGRFNVDEVGRVWLTDEDTTNWQLRAFTLDAGRFEPLAVTRGTFSVPTWGLIARGGQAAVIDSQGLHLFELETDGGIAELSFEGFPSFGMPMPDGPWCMQLVPPGRVAALSPLPISGQSACFFFSGGGVTCPTLLSPTSLTLGSGGADDDGAWWTDGVRIAVWSAADEADAGRIISVPSSLTFGAPDCTATEASPIVAGTGLIARRGPDGILLEKYPTPPGAPVHATSRYVVVNDNGTWRWWDR